MAHEGDLGRTPQELGPKPLEEVRTPNDLLDQLDLAHNYVAERYGRLPYDDPHYADYISKTEAFNIRINETLAEGLASQPVSADEFVRFAKLACQTGPYTDNLPLHFYSVKGVLQKVLESNYQNWDEAERSAAGTKLFKTFGQLPDKPDVNRFWMRPATIQGGWYNHFSRHIALETGLTQYSVNNMVIPNRFGLNVVSHVKKHKDLLSPYGQVAFAYCEAYHGDKRGEMVREIMGATEITQKFFILEPEHTFDFEEYVATNQDELIASVGRVSKEKANRLQFWALDSFSRLIEYMGESGSGNAKIIADQLAKLRGRSDYSHASILPVSSVMKLSKSLGAKVPGLSETPINPNDLKTLGLAIDQLFHIAHFVGTPSEQYETERPRIESIMNIIRTVTEVSLYLQAEVEVPLTVQHIKVLFPEADHNMVRKLIASKPPEERANLKPSQLSLEFRAMERAQKQHASHRLFTEGGALS